MNDLFRRFAHTASRIVANAWAFVIALLLIAVWAFTGPIFGFSDTWQLIINTTTTIVTFLMVFLIQNTQNRDATAIHLKLDELIRALKGARNSIIDLEDLSDEQLEKLQEEFVKLRKRGDQPAPESDAIQAALEQRRSGNSRRRGRRRRGHRKPASSQPT